MENFNLNTPMDRYEYMQMPFDIISQEINNRYKINDIAHNGKVYIDTQKGMYGIPQYEIVAHDRLKTPGEARILTF